MFKDDHLMWSSWTQPRGGYYYVHFTGGKTDGLTDAQGIMLLLPEDAEGKLPGQVVSGGNCCPRPPAFKSTGLPSLFSPSAGPQGGQDAAGSGEGITGVTGALAGGGLLIA